MTSIISLAEAQPAGHTVLELSYTLEKLKPHPCSPLPLNTCAVHSLAFTPSSLMPQTQPLQDFLPLHISFPLVYGLLFYCLPAWGYCCKSFRMIRLVFSVHRVTFNKSGLVCWQFCLVAISASGAFSSTLPFFALLKHQTSHYHSRFFLSLASEVGLKKREASSII